jgi:hypothetical protein
MHCGANLEAHLYLPCREAIFRHAEAASYGVAPCSVESERSVLVVVFFLCVRRSEKHSECFHYFGDF